MRFFDFLLNHALKINFEVPTKGPRNDYEKKDSELIPKHNAIIGQVLDVKGAIRRSDGVMLLRNIGVSSKGVYTYYLRSYSVDKIAKDPVPAVEFVIQAPGYDNLIINRYYIDPYNNKIKKQNLYY